jgi:hypothetical protein
MKAGCLIILWLFAILVFSILVIYYAAMPPEP